MTAYKTESLEAKPKTGNVLEPVSSSSHPHNLQNWESRSKTHDWARSWASLFQLPPSQPASLTPASLNN